MGGVGIQSAGGVVPCTLYSITYDVIGVPPSFVGALHVRDTLCNPGVVLKLVGAFGGENAVAFTISLGGPGFTAFVAKTRKSYA